jgi:predicted ATPase
MRVRAIARFRDSALTNSGIPSPIINQRRATALSAVCPLSEGTPMRRYIITGSPGAGKTTILTALRDRGYPVVGEAVTDLITRSRARGDDERWNRPDFIDAIVREQRRRERLPVPPGAAAQVFDRSAVCTLALARYVGHPVTPQLAGEIDRIVAGRIYQPRVFFVRLLGFVTPTAARRITYEQTVRFERFHEEAYREHGFDLIDVPAGPVADRADLIDGHIQRWSVTRSDRA